MSSLKKKLKEVIQDSILVDARKLCCEDAYSKKVSNKSNKFCDSYEIPKLVESIMEIMGER